MPEKTRSEAYELLCEFTESDSLRKHALAVEAAMLWYAKQSRLSDSEVQIWGMTGLLHDFDYEKWPGTEAPDGHPFKGREILQERGYPEDLITAIMGHANYSGVPRESLLAKTLYAVDELTGLITASVLVRPDRSLHTLTAKSVKKKMKDKAFARGCDREDIRRGAEELEIDLTEHITNVIEAMRLAADDLELAGPA